MSSGFSPPVALACHLKREGYTGDRPMGCGVRPQWAAGLSSVSPTHLPESALSPLQFLLFSAACL